MLTRGAFLGLLALACGGRNIVEDGAAATGGATSTISATGGGANLNTGGLSSQGGGTSEGALGDPVTIKAFPSTGDQNTWCVGIPGGCSNYAITVSDLNGPLTISSLCSVDCDTCAPHACPPVVCMQPIAVTSLVTIFEWNASYYVSQRCGANSMNCTAIQSALRGFYTFKIPTFLNPTPGVDTGCSQASSSTPIEYVSTSLWYPNQITIPLGL